MLVWKFTEYSVAIFKTLFWKAFTTLFITLRRSMTLATTMYVRSIRNTQNHAYIFLNIQTSKEIVNGRPIRIVRIPKPNCFTYKSFYFFFCFNFFDLIFKVCTYYFLLTFTFIYIFRVHHIIYPFLTYEKFSGSAQWAIIKIKVQFRL